MIWVVVNRATGIVVSRWPTEEEAWADKDARDAEWSHVEPPHESKLVVEAVQVT